MIHPEIKRIFQIVFSRNPENETDELALRLAQHVFDNADMMRTKHYPTFKPEKVGYYIVHLDNLNVESDMWIGSKWLRNPGRVVYFQPMPEKIKEEE